MRRYELMVAGVIPALVLAICGIACAPALAPPPIPIGAPCATCGMEVQDLRFACERGAARQWRVYDSIECLLRDREAHPGAGTYLADYDGRTLHAAESLWVVQGAFPSPMGGGYAAFLDRAGADELASRTAGRVARLETFATGAGR